jgi:hypothetical protein
MPFNLDLSYLVHTLMMEGKKGVSTVSTDSKIKPVLRGLPWEKEKWPYKTDDLLKEVQFI